MSAVPRAGRDRWDEIQRLFTAAVELPSTDRARFVRDATTDEVVREEVESLLAAHGLIAEHLDEVERDGKTAMGEPKYWHVFHIVARKR